jgi:glucans biosynthesis protein
MVDAVSAVTHEPALELGPRYALLPIASASGATELVLVDGGVERFIGSVDGFDILDAASKHPILRVLPTGSLKAAGIGNEIAGASASLFVVNSPAGDTLEVGRMSKLTVISPTDVEPSVSVVAEVASPSVIGNATFTIPASISASETVVDVRLDLKFQQSVAQIGVAPLHSMFLFDAANRADFDDYRTSVHNSDGLWMRSGEGQLGWRSLNNPSAVANSYFSHLNPSAFGLIQRQRSFLQFQDANAHYEQRPSVVVEPSDGWGQGFVRLTEAPSRQEGVDNIVAFWLPEGDFSVGAEAQFRYRLRWSDDTAQSGELATAGRFSAGRGGASGVDNQNALRKFVLDFVGRALGEAELPTGPLDAFVSVAPGQVEHVSIFRLAPETMRLAIDASIDSAGPVELRAYLIGGGKQLTETWMYQWHGA